MTIPIGVFILIVIGGILFVELSKGVVVTLSATSLVFGHVLRSIGPLLLIAGLAFLYFGTTEMETSLTMITAARDAIRIAARALR